MPASPRRLTFGAHASEYERARPDWPEEAARWLVPEDSRLVVELGAGTGKLTRALVAVAPRVLAVEPDPRMLALLRERGLEGVEGAAEAIPLGDGAADAVVAGSSMHWFELGPALAEIHRVLRPGGRLAFGWNHRADGHPAIARMSEAIYEPQERRDRPRWRERDWVREVTADGLFAAVEYGQCEHVHELPRDALHDHLMSYSGVAALPPALRDEVFRRVSTILEGDPAIADGETLKLPFVVNAYRATRAEPGASPSP